MALGRGVAIAVAPALLLAAVAWLAAGELPNAVNWYVIRSAGLVSYGLLSLTTALGLGLALRVNLPVLPKVDTLALHRGGTQLAFAFLAVHLGALLGDRFMSFSLAAIAGGAWGSYRPLAVWLGSLAAWLLLTATAAFALRRTLAAGRWRVWHRIAYAGWLLALIHGVASGADRDLPAAQWLYLSTGLAITGLLAFRLLWRRSAGKVPVAEAPLRGSGASTFAT